MMTKRRIALLVGSMLVGAQVGIASMTDSSALSEQQSEMPLQAEATEPTATPEPAETQASAEQVAAPEQQAAAEAGYVVPARPRTLADATFPALHSDVFPPSTDDRPLPPSAAAYLERKAANTLLAHAGAAGSPFPESDEPGQRILPVQLAYFERLEAQQLAAYEQRILTEREQAASIASTVETRAVDNTAQPEAERIAGTIQQ